MFGIFALMILTLNADVQKAPFRPNVVDLAEAIERQGEVAVSKESAETETVTCIFFHGIGYDHSIEELLYGVQELSEKSESSSFTNTLEEYWASSATDVDCDEKIFTKFNTIWSDMDDLAEQTEKLCPVIESRQKVVVIAHSFGNAIATTMSCFDQIDHFISVASPWNGENERSIWTIKSFYWLCCDDVNSVDDSLPWYCAPYVAVGATARYCGATFRLLDPTYESSAIRAVISDNFNVLPEANVDLICAEEESYMDPASCTDGPAGGEKYLPVDMYPGSHSTYESQYEGSSILGVLDTSDMVDHINEVVKELKGEEVAVAVADTYGCYNWNVNLVGEHLDSKNDKYQGYRRSHYDCQYACELDAECKFFTFEYNGRKDRGGRCFFASSDADKRHATSHVVSGSATCVDFDKTPIDTPQVDIVIFSQSNAVHLLAMIGMLTVLYKLAAYAMTKNTYSSLTSDEVPGYQC